MFSKTKTKSTERINYAKKILKQLQSNYDMEAEDIEAFKKLEEFIEKIFNNSDPFCHKYFV